MSQIVGISLLGCGVVGSGVLKILESQRSVIERRTGLVLDVRHVVVRDPARTRDIPQAFPKDRIHTDAARAIDDPAVSIVVELIGGTTYARELTERALLAGKHIVTANKSLLALAGPELFKLARQRNSSISFEASCAGGIPIIDALLRGLSANRIDALIGIVNGTCNFILSKMTRENMGYAEALAEAQALGFAEADPTLDVSGRDAAQKLAVLSTLAFGAHVREEDIERCGIDGLAADDIRYAGEFGHVIKLLASASRSKSGALRLRVSPTLVPQSDMLAQVSGSFNAVSVYGHALGHAMFYGRGAGQLPTGSAVVADILSTATGVGPAMFAALRSYPDSAETVRVEHADETESCFYIRLSVEDRPGVLAAVTDALGRASISLRAILQHESNTSDAVPVVILTHRCRTGALREALRQINALPANRATATCLPVLESPAEFA